MTVKFLDIQHITRSFQPALEQAIHRVVESGWFLHGSETKAFEDEFAQYCGKTYCVGVANGLDALYITLAAMRSFHPEWQDDDEVIVPAMTFVATAEAVTRAGLRPVLVDVGPDALIDHQQLHTALSPRTRAVIPVHLYGQPAHTASIRQWADDHQIFVLEDAAQAHGAPHVAHYGHAAAFSFYPGKNLGALGDGGAIVTDDAQLAERVRTLANYGAAHKYQHDLEGCNSRLDELQAAVLRVKLRRLNADNDCRRHIARRYYAGISNPLVTLLPEDALQGVWHIFPVFTPHRDALASHLKTCGIETLIHYPLAIHEQGCMKDRFRATTDLTMALSIAQNELSIPISPILTDEEIQRVIDAINTFQLPSSTSHL